MTDNPNWTLRDVDGEPIHVHADKGRLVSISLGNSACFADLTATQAYELGVVLLEAARVSDPALSGDED